MLISPERNDRLIREQVFQDVIELREILSLTDDLNPSRERLKALAANLEYILLDEA